MVCLRIDERRNEKMAIYRVTYEVVGTVTVSVMASSPELALKEAEKEYPETDINFNHMLNVLAMEPTAVECPDGKVVEV
jgi:hypothetical protein